MDPQDQIEDELESGDRKDKDIATVEVGRSGRSRVKSLGRSIKGTVCGFQVKCLNATIVMVGKSSAIIATQLGGCNHRTSCNAESVWWGNERASHSRLYLGQAPLSCYPTA